METGKKICQALKNLRKRIADANEIPFEIEECTHRAIAPVLVPNASLSCVTLWNPLTNGNRKENQLL